MSTPVPPAAPHDSPRMPAASSPWHRDKKRALMVLLGLVTGVEFLESLMFVFAASDIMGGVAAAPIEFARVQAAYAIGSMLTIAMQQWCARHFGYRRYLAGALLLYMAGALASASSGGLGELAFGRALQGLGGGAFFTSARILVTLVFAPADRPRALKYFLLTIFGMSALAPVLAAQLLDTWGWRAIFLAALPPAALAFAGLAWLLPTRAGRSTQPVQWSFTPVLLFALAIVSLQLALSQARYEVFTEPGWLVLGAAAGLLFLAGFAWHQWRHHAPLVNLRELHQSTYLTGLALYFLYYCLSNYANYLFPIFAQRSLGLPLLTVGWLNTFSASVSLVLAYVYVRVGKHFPRKRPLMALGALALAVAAWSFSTLPENAAVPLLLLGLVSKGVFAVLLVLPVAGLTFRQLGEERFAHGYQGKNLMRQMAGSFATALAAILLQDRQLQLHDAAVQRLTPANPGLADWLAQARAHFAAHGMDAQQSGQAALELLGRVVDQQVHLLACEDLYRWLAAAAVLTACVVVGQRKLA